jgi:hypothetical protein
MQNGPPVAPVQHIRPPHAVHGHVVQPGAGWNPRQFPRTQISSDAQSFPHEPQCVWLVLTSTQLVPQTWSDAPEQADAD